MEAMPSESPFVEVVGPDGRAVIVGRGPFGRHAGGPFSIIAYPYGTAELAVLRGRPTYVEPVRTGDEYRSRLDELVQGVREGAWMPPDLSDAERAALEARAMKRQAAGAWAQRHPVRSAARATLRVAAFIAVVLLVGAVADLVSGRGFSSPTKPFLVALGAWLLLLSTVSVWVRRKSSTG